MIKLTVNSTLANKLFKRVESTQDLMFNLPGDRPQKAVDILANVPVYFKGTDSKMHRASTDIMHNPRLLRDGGLILTKKPLIDYFDSRIHMMKNILLPNGKPAPLNDTDKHTIAQYEAMKRTVIDSKRKYFVHYVPTLFTMKREKEALTSDFALECQAQSVVDYLFEVILHPDVNHIYVDETAEKKAEAVEN